MWNWFPKNKRWIWKKEISIPIKERELILV